jgi:Na+/H+-dicarboxylate symporter
MVGQMNIVFGWAWMVLGLIFGMALGMWAEREEWLGGYASLPRRYLRLAHVAFIALSIINILYGKELGAVDLPISIKNVGSYLTIFGTAGVPLTCISAAFFRKTKYFLPLPALAVLAGTLILVIGLIV